MLDNSDNNLNKEDLILEEAATRFKYLLKIENDNRQRWLEDVKFANGDPDNGWQWGKDVDDRLSEGKPTLTENIIKAHNRAIINEYRLNKTSPKISPEGKGSNKKAAEVLNSIIRKIENQSSADEAYTLAEEFAVDGGLGYYRLTTEYIEDSFDQEIFIRKVKNPLNVLVDLSGDTFRDRKYAFIIEDILKEDFNSKYPDVSISSFDDDLLFGLKDTDKIRLCEYFRVVTHKEKIIQLPNGSTEFASDLTDFNIKGLRSREVEVPTVEWYLLGGNTILERGIWAGKYIPIIKVVGNELVIGDEVYRSGHTRALKDAQKLHNFWTSSAVEYVKLAGKQPYLADAKSIEGYEAYWNTMNQANYPYLPFNSIDQSGRQLPIPQRQAPPILPDAYLQGLQISSQSIQDISGQYQQQLGQQPGDQSGVAIRNLQVKSDVATFHFFDNANNAKLDCAWMLVDLIPKIYDTNRMIKIIGEDGEETELLIDPNAKLPITEKEDIQQIFNPKIGKYTVSATTGASYSTKRQEQSEALLALAQINPNIWQIAGDLIVKSQDWLMGDEIADRIKRSLPSNITGIQPEIPQEIQDQLAYMQDQINQKDSLISQMDNAIQQMTSIIENKDKELQLKAEKVDIDKFNAETNRIKVVGG